MIAFGELMPDLPPLNNPGLLRTTNLVPYRTHYGPWQDLVTYTNALDAFPRGSAAFVDTSLNTFVFAGNETKLYRLSNATWSDVSVGGGYSTGTDERWKFAVFSDTAIATNFSDKPQKWTLGTSSAWAALGTNTPNARYVAVVRDFVVFGYTDTSPNQVNWSPINAPDGDYTDDVDTQSGSQILPTGNEIMAVIGGEIGLVICKTAIYRMIYVGGSDIFQFDNIVGHDGQSDKRGAVAPGSVATDGERTFFYGESGFFMTDSQRIIAIGESRVDEFFRMDADSGSFINMSSAIDPNRPFYLLGYTSTANSGSKIDKILVYNYEINRWGGPIEVAIQDLASSLTTGYTLEQLDNISTSIDALPASLDSREWAGGALVFGAFDGDNKFGNFGGDNLAATVETGDVQLGALKQEEGQIPNHSGARTYVTGLRFLTDSASWTARVGHRDTLSASQNWTDSKSPNGRSGIAPFRNDARYQRAEFTIPAAQEWSYVQGFDVNAGPSSAV